MGRNKQQVKLQWSQGNISCCHNRSFEFGTTMPAVKTTCSQDLGKLLLKGWAMLAENCPECQVPLMRNPADKSHKLCVNCSTQCGKPGAGNAANGNAPSMQHADTASGEDVEGDDYDSCSDPRMGPFARQPPKTTAHSSLQVPPELPFTNSFSTANIANQTSTPTAASGREAAAHTTAHERSSMTGPQCPAGQPPSKQRVKVKGGDTAEKLSDYLLQGWCLMDAYCPRCSTVLVRNKQKKRYCIDCEAWIMTEEEAAAAASAAATTTAAAAGSNARETGAAAAVAPAAVPSDPAASSAVTSAAVASTPPPAAGTQSQPGGPQAPLAIGPSTSSPPHAAAASALPQIAAVHGLGAAESALVRKLEEAGQLLASTSAWDTVRCVALAGMMSACADALGKLQALQTN